MLFFAYLFAERNIMSAWVISILMFILTTVIYIFYLDYFDRKISGWTVVVILSSLAAWGIGEILAKLFFKGRYHYSYDKVIKSNASYTPISMPKWFALIATICAVLLAVYEYYLLYNISLLGGNTEGLFKAAKYARSYMIANNIEISDSIIISQLKILFECIAYFFGYVFLYNLIYCKEKKYRYLGPVLGYCLMIISTTGRVDYVKLACVLCIMAFVFIKEKSNWRATGNKKIIKIAFLTIIAAIIVFRLTGYLTDKSAKYAFGENIARYTAGGTLGLDIYLENPIRSTLLWGQQCFRSIYVTLSELGFNIPWYNPFPPFYIFGAGISSNGYTGLYEPLKDFGFSGMLVTRLLLGFLYGFFVELIMQKKNEQLSPVRLIVLGLLFYPVSMVAIGDVYASIISVSFLYKLFYLFLLQYFFLSRTKKR